MPSHDAQPVALTKKQVEKTAADLPPIKRPTQGGLPNQMRALSLTHLTRTIHQKPVISVNVVAIRNQHLQFFNSFF